MVFDTMASFKHLLQSGPKATDVECLTTHSVKRQDSFTMLSDTKRRAGIWGPDIPPRAASSHKLLRPNKPSSLPGKPTAPSFQSAKSKWSPPPSPGSIPGRSLSEPPLMTAKEKNALANQLFAAACAGDLTAIELLLECGAPIDSPVLVPALFEAFQPPKSGHLSPLAGASLNGQLSAVKLLLRKGADLGSRRSSSSPLHQACRNNDIDVVRYLLQQGAEIDMVDSYKVTPLMYACKYSSADIVSLLLEHSPNLNAVSFLNAGAIHWSVWPGKVLITELLLKSNLSLITQEMSNGNTPLHCAVLAGTIEMVKVLLRYGADPLRTNENGETPLMLAETQCESGSRDIPRALKAAVFDMRWS